MSWIFWWNITNIISEANALADIYTLTNDITTRTLDSHNFTMEQLANVIATVIKDIQVSSPIPWENNLGYLNIPILEKSADYTTILTDSGKCILHPVTDSNDRYFILWDNDTVPYSAGTGIVFKNNSTNDIVIASLNDIYQDGTGDLGFFTLSQYGKATVLKEESTVWSIGGVWLTRITPASFTRTSENLANLDTLWGSSTWTITFSAPVLFTPTIRFYDVNTNGLAGWTISVTWWLGTDTITVSWTAPTDFEDVYIKGISVSNTGYYLVDWVSNNYTLF